MNTLKEFQEDEYYGELSDEVDQEIIDRIDEEEDEGIMDPREAAFSRGENNAR